MPLRYSSEPLEQLQVDAVVSSVNPNPVIRTGVDTALHKAAGPQLLQSRRSLGRIPVGQAVITHGFGLRAKYVIHVVVPAWMDGTCGERQRLADCYEAALALARQYGCRSVAFPLLGEDGEYPRQLIQEVAWQILTQEQTIDILVAAKLAPPPLPVHLRRAINSYLQANYILPKQMPAIQAEPIVEACVEVCLPKADERIEYPLPKVCEAPCAAPMPAPSASLTERLRHLDVGFSERVLQLIDRTGKKDSQIYKKANLSKQHFSKIRNNPDYRPTKATALALAIALELNMEQTLELIGRAGYSLTNSSKFDVIIMYFIENRVYDIIQINMALYEFDQTLLGA